MSIVFVQRFFKRFNFFSYKLKWFACWCKAVKQTQTAKWEETAKKEECERTRMFDKALCIWCMHGLNLQLKFPWVMDSGLNYHPNIFLPIRMNRFQASHTGKIGVALCASFVIHIPCMQLWVWSISLIRWNSTIISIDCKKTKCIWSFQIQMTYIRKSGRILSRVPWYLWRFLFRNV